jgi:hypothetical protein
MHDALTRWLTLSVIAVVALGACGGDGSVPVPISTPTPSPEPETVVVDDPEPVATPEYCPPAVADGLQDVGGTPASPYFVKHPDSPNATTQTIMFLPCGRGSERGAERVWSRYMAEGAGLEAFRVVILYGEDFDLLDDTRRVLGIVPELLACYGGEPGSVHLAGVSNGGLIAFWTNP